MAKPKVEVIVNIIRVDLIEVFCSDRDNVVVEIAGIEGIIHVSHLAGAGCIHILTDPRYDINELRDEIYQLLTASIPDVFRE